MEREMIPRGLENNEWGTAVRKSDNKLFEYFTVSVPCGIVGMVPFDKLFETQIYEATFSAAFGRPVSCSEPYCWYSMQDKYDLYPYITNEQFLNQRSVDEILSTVTLTRWDKIKIKLLYLLLKCKTINRERTV